MLTISRKQKMNIIDSLTPHKLSEDEANDLLSGIGEAQKDEILPSLTCQNCKKDLNPEKDKFYDSPEGQFCENCMVAEEAKYQNRMEL